MGNRAAGDRLGALVPFAAQKLAAGVLLLAPCLPLLFMGEEYGEPYPFPYFTSHTDRALAAAVSKGRREEFAAFAWQGEVPDPQAEATFASARLQHGLAAEGQHRALRDWYRALLRLRRDLPALAALDRHRLRVHADGQALTVLRWTEADTACAVFSFSDRPLCASVPLPAGRWERALDAADTAWAGEGSALPPAIEAEGRVSLPLGPWACLLLHRRLDR